MKILTIHNKLSQAEAFDRQVNEAIEQGWVLSKREFIPGIPLTGEDYRPCMLYAELVMLDAPAEPEPLDIFACAEIIKAECERHTSCQECPLEDVCECRPPHEWKPPHREG